MKLFELLNKDQPKGVVFTFGNCNPPHAGHLGLVKFAARVALENNADWHIFLSESEGVMSPQQKVAWLIEWCKADGINAEGKIHHVPKIYQSSLKLYDFGYRKAIFVAGEGDYESYWPFMERTNQYNKINVSPESEKYFYFDPFVGRENKLSEGGDGRITSGTAVRQSATQLLTNNDEESIDAFWKAASAGDSTLARKIQHTTVNGQKYLNTIKTGLEKGIKIHRHGAKHKNGNSDFE